MTELSILKNEPLANYTSWRVGGPAERLIKPKTINELATFLYADDLGSPIIFLGLGSNALVRDEGVKGTVVIQSGINEMTLTEGACVRAEVGVPSPKLARFCAKNNLTGLEFLATVPGLVGGALAMNAGAYGGETWDFVKSVEVINRRGETIQREPSEFEVGYRSVIGKPDEYFVAVTFALPAGDAKQSLEKIKGFLEHRANTQPTSDNSCGSVFRNPDEDHAGRLIEACGLKGFSIGGASVSEKHANFIINRGEATAADIEHLIEAVENKVKQFHGIELVREVKII